MHKLAGLDAGFLYNETPRAPQHIASVQVLELPPGTQVATFVDDFKRQLVERAHLVPYFTNKLQFVPLQLDHPVWVRAEPFDIDDHVRHVEVPQPGSRKEFEAMIAALHARPLDRSKPLWEIWVLSGLERGRIAYYHRVHHACLDGVSGQKAIQAIMDVTPAPRAIEPPPPGFAHRPKAHSAIDMLIGACENVAKFQIRQAGRALDHAETLQRLWQRIIDPTKGLGAVVDQAPSTRFNRAVHGARTYATGELSLVDVKAIGKATSTTINDVFLAICSGALRRYLGRTGDLPEKSLKAGCPVSLRQRGDDSANNQVTMMMVSFATDEADPVKRLLNIGRSSRQAKGFVAAIAGSFDADLVLPGLPGLVGAGAGLMESGELADGRLSRMPCNVVVSNVPGPSQQLYSLGARMLTHYPVSIPAHGQGVNITVQSYMDQLFFGVTACARALPDADALRDDMLAAYAELKEQLIQSPTALARREPLSRGQAAAPVRNPSASAAA